MRAGYPLDSVPGGGTGVPPEDLPRSRERPSQCDQSLFGESQLSLAATNKYLALMNKSADGGRATNERSALEPSSSMRRSPRSPQRKRSTSILLRRLDHRRKRRCRRMKSLRRTDAGTSPDSRDGILIKAGKTKVRTIPRHRTRTTLHRRQRTSISTSTRRTGYT